MGPPGDAARPVFVASLAPLSGSAASSCIYPLLRRRFHDTQTFML
jgi:hypothetical protein